jgi:hypothetical protein
MTKGQAGDSSDRSALCWCDACRSIYINRVPKILVRRIKQTFIVTLVEQELGTIRSTWRHPSSPACPFVIFSFGHCIVNTLSDANFSTNIKYIQNTNKKYHETCLNQNLNKPKSCITRTLNKVSM